MITKEQIETEVNHIFESGANEIRVTEFFWRMIEQMIRHNQFMGLQAENERLRETMKQEYDLAHRQLYDKQRHIESLNAENARLQAENERLRKALTEMITSFGGREHFKLQC